MNLGFRACFGIGKHSPERYPPQRGGANKDCIQLNKAKSKSGEYCSP